MIMERTNPNTRPQSPTGNGGNLNANQRNVAQIFANDNAVVYGCGNNLIINQTPAALIAELNRQNQIIDRLLALIEKLTLSNANPATLTGLNPNAGAIAAGNAPQRANAARLDNYKGQSK